MIETVAPRARGRGAAKRPHSRNKNWSVNEQPTTRNTGERWERGGRRGGHHRNMSFRPPKPSTTTASEAEEEADTEMEDTNDEAAPQTLPEPETMEEREQFWRQLVQERELERKKAIAEGKMDDPLVPKRLEDAITIVGTCPDMCPRFERYRRERENNLFQWEMVPGTKRVDHARAVKMYERAVGDKSIPSDIRPPEVLKRTLDYLFHELLVQNGFTRTYDFIRDRSRAVRNDFTLQHESGPLAIECHDRCARYHILALHYGREISGFSINMEEQQLMQTLQSLKEFYEDQRGRYESPTELEMRVYHRLIHIRDQRERPDSVPEHITSHPVFKLTTEFRLHVQKKSEPIQKNSPLKVGPEGMEIFGKLVEVLKQEGNIVMIFLVACILERLFGVDTIEDIEEIRQGLRDEDVIDGISHSTADDATIEEAEDEIERFVEEVDNDGDDEDEMDQMQGESETQESSAPQTSTAPTPAPSIFAQPSPFGQSSGTSAFSTLASTPNAFSNLNVFGKPSVFGGGSVFGKPPPTTTSVFGAPPAAPPGPLPTSQSAPSTISAQTQPSSIFGGGTPLTSNGVAEPPKVEVLKDKPTLNPQATIFQPRAQPALSIFSKPLVAEPQPVMTPPAMLPPPPPLPKAEPETKAPVPTPLTSSQPQTMATSPESISAPPPSLLHRRTSSSSTISLPKIFTDIGGASNSPSIFTPLGKTPPAAPKPLPISLPPTPGISALKGSSFTGLLSPLTFSPTVSRANSLKSFPMPFASPRKGSLNKEPEKEKEVEKVVEVLPPAPSKEEDEQAAYAKAVQKSDEYSRRQKERRNQAVESISAPPRLSTNPSLPARKKRQRTQLSKEYKPPITDEELAKRLKGNRDEHERRWAQGTFLQAIRRFFQSYPALQNDDNRTTLWLSMNPENDGTAIWVERKFDVPNNPGEWYTDSIYTIPIRAGSSSKVKQAVESPIVIVFECTPLESIDDDIERKFRVLEDCARLRQIIKTFPEKRWRVPSLLIFRWASETMQDLPLDMTQMISAFVEGGTLESYGVLNIASDSKDLDTKFVQTLAKMEFDVAGRLVCAVTLNGIYSHFEALWKGFVSRWLNKCTRRGEFDHAFYAKVIHILFGVLEHIDAAAASLLQAKKKNWPVFSPDAVDDTESLYDSAIAWLSNSPLLTSDEIIMDLESHRIMERDFPSDTFTDQLWQAMKSQEGSPVVVRVMKLDLDTTIANLKKLLDAKELVLQQVYSIATRREPKRRRESSTAASECDTSVFSTPGSKRRRLSSSLDGPTASPTPSPAPFDENMTEDVTVEPQPKKPFVSISMLRALTKEMRGKYGRVS